MISKLMLLELVTIQVKKQLLLNKGLSNDVIDKLLLCDPTNKYKNDSDKVGSYTDWIVSRYLKDRTFNDFAKLHSLLELYDKSKHKIPDKELQNIGLFKSLIEFITFVNNNQDKLNVVPADFIVEEKNDYDMFYSKNYIIHVPRTEELSKKLGSGTKWCTSLEKDNYFQSYYNKGYLFYITSKTTTLKRYNLYLHKYGIEIEFANDKNKHLTYKLFDIVKEDNTLIPLIKTYFEYKNINPTYKLQLFFNCKTISDIIEFWEDNINNFADIYFEKDENKLLDSIYMFAESLQFIPNPSPKIQLLLLTKDIDNINFIESPDNIVLKNLVSQDGKLIEYIIKAGIKPNNDIQLLLVSEDGYLIKYIINAGVQPEHDVQLLLVTNNGYLIKYIIDAGIRPEHDVQLLLVSNDGYLIEYIINAGVQPEDENEWHNIQLLLVTNNGYLIEYIINAGIKPSEDVQLLLVSRCGVLIKYIENPSEKIQLLLIKQLPDLYGRIEHPTPQLTLLYKQIKGITESTGYISKLLDVN